MKGLSHLDLVLLLIDNKLSTQDRFSYIVKKSLRDIFPLVSFVDVKRIKKCPNTEYFSFKVL
jgi:hypothetical protein